MKDLYKLTKSREVLQSWNPRNELVKQKKKEVIRKILSQRHIHTFKNVQVAIGTTQSSVWYPIVNELYSRRSKSTRKKLVKYFAAVSRTLQDGRSTFLSTFVDTVILLHRENCNQCKIQTNVVERMEPLPPRRKEVEPKKFRFIARIVHKIHRLTNIEASKKMSIKTVWRGHVDEYFAQQLGRNHPDVIKCLGAASFPQFFGSFVNVVVMVHRRHCEQCEFQRNAWERVELLNKV